MKNVIIVVLVVGVLVEGYFLLMKKQVPAALGETTQTQPSPNPTRRALPAPLAKGDKFAGSAVEKFAHKIAPGAISADSQAFLTGFTVKTNTLADGSEQVDLIPKDSDDQFQSYILKSGNSLYFIEMTQGDDKPDTDKDMNYRDDYGIVVDANGIVQ